MSDLDVDTELLLFLGLEERSEDPCEHSQHDLYTDKHAGPGEWLIRSKGHGCPFSGDEVKLICDKYKRVAFDAEQYFRCSCGFFWTAQDAYTLLGRKGVDF